MRDRTTERTALLPRTGFVGAGQASGLVPRGASPLRDSAGISPASLRSAPPRQVRGGCTLPPAAAARHRPADGPVRHGWGRIQCVPGPFAGRLLVATPGLQDPNFARTVVYLLDEGEHGALGVVLNRPTAVSLLDVLPAWFTVAS